MWINYLKKTGLVAESFDAVVDRLERFLDPCLKEIRLSGSRETNRWNPDQARWE
jgi:hypothetical protein